MESSESETDLSLPLSISCNDERDIDEKGYNVTQSSDSGVSTSSETSSCEDCNIKGDLDQPISNRRDTVTLLQALLPWRQKSRAKNLSYIDKVGGTLALIQHPRPPNLPSKSLEEERCHQKQYTVILAQARKREIEEELARRCQREEQLRREEKLAAESALWTNSILPQFETVKNTKKVQDLWWAGLPPSIRGKVWKLGIANDLDINSDEFDLCIQRLNKDALLKAKDESILAIKLDVSRTFSNLGVFQEGGPLHESLQGLLSAYAVYRKDIGYVQGMSFLGAILTLNMEPEEAFVCFANLLNKPYHQAAFTLNQKKMDIYYRVFSSTLAHKIPKIHGHFRATGLSPDLYLLDWLYTVFAKAMPLDVVCRIWDVFIRDGDEFLFRTALGILRMFQNELLSMDFVRCSQFLTKLPDNLEASVLFDNIGKINTSIGAQTFQDMISQLS
ncbi:TBC1 domain family member 14-like [Venturia canescens]|uniref:TBC1 domain family member 14-like n=1 Tax=Venturia canescens TaxID=32260 RepID=UPI001C9C890D|nr:TBC1 domain family member 14-like [Venturia canescens]